ncbi:hypothetical protein ABZ725_47580 [Streptomyces sp. NPDC006872]|uniref:hypothetical protein n=1 Tax=Streptomyces sp. NPDC006872 TaxID=3155720 RepID=UPI0033F0CDDE
MPKPSREAQPQGHVAREMERLEEEDKKQAVAQTPGIAAVASKMPAGVKAPAPEATSNTREPMAAPRPRAAAPARRQ